MKKFLTLTLLSLLVGVSAQADTAKLYVNTTNISWWTSDNPSIWFTNGTESTNWNDQSIKPTSTVTLNGTSFDVYEYDTKYTKAIVRRGNGSELWHQTSDITLGGIDKYIRLKGENDKGKDGFGNDTYNWDDITFYVGSSVTIYYIQPKSQGWYTVNAYIYGGDSNKYNWPGESMSYLGERDNSYVYFFNVNTCLDDFYAIYTEQGNDNNRSTKYGESKPIKGYIHRGIDATDIYSRTFATAGKKYTVCLPFALTSSEVSSLGKFYAFTSAEGNNVTFTEVNETSACVPYIFEPADDNKTITSTGKTIEFNLAAMNVTNGDVTFKGTLANIETSDFYGFQDSQLTYASSTMKIGEFRAYIKTTSGGAKLNVTFGDETGIQSLSGNNNDNVYYDLQGRRALNPQKGLYILNGKKVIL